ncbi:VOC family protein [Henriciella litoralis]|uniref:VOC family protein n=1 Tax=Henriciella litoralis TaxID=568102 RepID=UPI000A057A1C|nr:VOC family protein [Henriciella litoralis]
MISHVTIGTNDIDRATGFYTPIMAALGLKRVPMERSAPFVMWTGQESFRPVIALTTPENGRPHEPGNGQMLALLAPDRAAVDRVHAIALKGGGRDEGIPGLRAHYHSNYYGAYFRDLDGNKICVVCHDPLDD